MAASGLFRKSIPDGFSQIHCLIVPNRTHLGYIPRQGRSKQYDDPWSRTKLQLIKVNMKPVKRVHYTFDPFHPRVDSIRHVIHHYSCERIQKSNPKCIFKTEVVCNRSEPTLKVELDEGNSLLFKTAHLTVEEIVTMINDYVLPRVKEETAVVTESKGAKTTAKKGKAGGKKK